MVRPGQALVLMSRLTWVLPTLWRAPRQPPVSHRLIHTGLASRASGCGAFGDLSGLVVVELWVVCFWGQLSNSFQLRNSATPPRGLRSWLAVGAFGDLTGLAVAELWVVCFWVNSTVAELNLSPSTTVPGSPGFCQPCGGRPDNPWSHTG